MTSAIYISDDLDFTLSPKLSEFLSKPFYGLKTPMKGDFYLSTYVLRKKSLKPSTQVT